MADPIPTPEAVEAAARTLYMRLPHAAGVGFDGLTSEERGQWLRDARAALTVAAPIIAAQATADFRAGIEALRDEWQMHEAANLRAASTQPENSSGLLLHTAIAGLCKAHADALDALLPEGE